MHATPRSLIRFAWSALSLLAMLICCGVVANAQQDTTRASRSADSASVDSVPVPRSAGEAEASGIKLLGLYDAADGHWISGATIRDTLGNESVTSSIGVAVLNRLTPIAGYYLVEIRKPGYAPRALRFRMDTTSEIMLALAPNPLGQGAMLAPVVVTATRRLAEDDGTRQGFIYRCQTGLVSCVGRSGLDKHPAGGFDALLDHVDGVKHTCGKNAGRPSFSGGNPNGFAVSTACHVQMTPLAGDSPHCTPTYFVNGFEWAVLGGDAQAQLEQFLNHSNIDGIEVYLPGHPVPARFMPPPLTSCGSVVIWTR
ncbi:MAG TPA: hypothetical protein VGM67_17310 [Gemmatimonadaceae bacterium]|jgi:hypothetical protein